MCVCSSKFHFGVYVKILFFKIELQHNVTTK